MTNTWYQLDKLPILIRLLSVYIQNTKFCRLTSFRGETIITTKQKDKCLSLLGINKQWNPVRKCPKHILYNSTTPPYKTHRCKADIISIKYSFVVFLKGFFCGIPQYLWTLYYSVLDTPNFCRLKLSFSPTHTCAQTYSCIRSTTISKWNFKSKKCVLHVSS